MSFLDTLTSSQQEAVKTSSGNLLILAGPGTGKTRVIISKILHLIETGTLPESILAITFSRKATQEMEERLNEYRSSLSETMTVSTIHAFCLDLVQKHGFRLGFQKRPVLMTEAQVQLFFRQVSVRLPIQPFMKSSNFEPVAQDLLQFFGDCKDQGLWPEDVIRYAEGLSEETEDELKIKEEWTALGDIYNAYQSFCFEQGHLDFGDAILCALRILEQFSTVRKEIHEKLKVILVDEFQDTNWVQIRLLRQLAGPDCHVAVVGDDDQSIYRFRGASYSAFHFFTSLFEDVKTVELKESFRLPPEVVTAAQTLIQTNGTHRFRPDKVLQSFKESPPTPIHLLKAKTFESEARSICDRIEKILNEGIKHGEIGVLVRAHSHADLFLNEAKRRGIPVEALSSQAIFDQPITLDMLALFRLIVDPSDTIAFLRLFDSPILRLKADETYEFFRWSKTLQGNLIDRLGSIEESPLPTESKERLSKFYETYKSLFAQSARQSPSELLQTVYEHLGPIQFLYQNDPDTLRVLGQFHSQLKEWELNQPQKDLRSLLPLLLSIARHEISLGQDEIAERDPTKVSVLTVHGSKGLEFDTVFILSLVSRRFPCPFKSSTWELPLGLAREAPPTQETFREEERRLFYVAMTRAKRKLILSTVEKKGVKQSSFITEDLKALLGNPNLFSIQEVEDTESGNLPPALSSPFSRILPPAEKRKPTKSFLSLSFTQIDLYETCPLAYRFRYDFKIPAKVSNSVVVGSIIHSALELFFKEIQRGKQPSCEELLEFYTSRLSEERKNNEALTENDLRLGQEKLQNYFELHKGKFPTPYAVEQEFCLKIGAIQIRGKIDRVDETKSGMLIIDYKTGRAKSNDNPEDRKFAQTSLQLSIYALAAKEIFNWKVSEYILYYIYENKTLSSTRSEEDLVTTKEKILEVASQIHNEKFDPTPGFHCQWCDFREICPTQ